MRERQKTRKGQIAGQSRIGHECSTDASSFFFPVPPMSTWSCWTAAFSDRAGQGLQNEDPPFEKIKMSLSGRLSRDLERPKGGRGSQ